MTEVWNSVELCPFFEGFNYYHINSVTIMPRYESFSKITSDYVEEMKLGVL